MSRCTGIRRDRIADLGKMAGAVYHYEGNPNSSDFESTYHSDYDHGTFNMTRPELP